MVELSNNPTQQIEAMVLDMMKDPEFTSSPGENKFESAKKIALNKYRQIDNNTKALTLGEVMSQLDIIKSITPEDIQNIVVEISKQVSQGAMEAKRRGLVPQSGDWNRPGRWIRDPRAQASFEREANKVINRKPATTETGATRMGRKNIKADLSKWSDSDFENELEHEIKTSKNANMKQAHSLLTSGDRKGAEEIYTSAMLDKFYR
jgi:hypothetical protein